jgi:hypothetical protein
VARLADRPLIHSMVLEKAVAAENIYSLLGGGPAIH